MGRERSAFHPGPESLFSNEGRIHLRKPTPSFSFSLASRRRTIHSGCGVIQDLLGPKAQSRKVLFRYAVTGTCAPKCAIMHSVAVETVLKVRRISHIRVG